MSKHEDAVIAKVSERAKLGLAKYGVTVERTDLTRRQWLQHAQDEAMDLAVYLQRLIDDEPDELDPLTESGTKAWANVPDGWLEDLRGDVPKGPEL